MIGRITTVGIRKEGTMEGTMRVEMTQEATKVVNEETVMAVLMEVSNRSVRMMAAMKKKMMSKCGYIQFFQIDILNDS
jgi:phosphoketolase